MDIQPLMQKQAALWQQVQRSRGLPHEATLLSAAKKAVRDYKQEARNRWVMSIIHTLEQAVAVHDMSTFYRTLPKLGIYMDEYS